MAYIGTSPSNGVRRRFVYEATASQTSFSGSDENGVTLTYVDSLYLDVFQNGIKLKAGDDYTATTGTTVVLVQGASANDVVEMVAFDVFSVNDSVSAKDGGSFAGNISSPIVTGSTSLRTPLIEFTDGDDAIAIADGGVVTLLTTAVAKSEGGAVTTNIAQGLAKAWVNFTGISTTAARDSFNVGSLTDISTGKTGVVYTNAMANGNYTGSFYTNASASGAIDDFNNDYTGSFGLGDNRTTALVNVASHNNSGLLDSFANDVIIHGDLA